MFIDKFEFNNGQKKHLGSILFNIQYITHLVCWLLIRPQDTFRFVIFFFILFLYLQICLFENWLFHIFCRLSFAGFNGVQCTFSRLSASILYNSQFIRNDRFQQYFIVNGIRYVVILIYKYICNKNKNPKCSVCI